jgi:hypothetical protein
MLSRRRLLRAVLALPAAGLAGCIRFAPKKPTICDSAWAGVKLLGIWIDGVEHGPDTPLFAEAAESLARAARDATFADIAGEPITISIWRFPEYPDSS